MAVNRVVSLVPSLTESIAAARPEALVGATEWCTHPAGLQVTRVRGTKNPDLAAIRALRPELVIANREENRRVDVERLRAAGIAVLVTDIRTVPDAIAELHRMFAALDWPAPQWLAAADRAWADTAPQGSRPAAIPIWRDPWMAVGTDTFTGDLVARLGLRNVVTEPRYPHIGPEQILDRGAELVVLPDEPYLFAPDDGPEAFPGATTVLVEGRLLTWYGPSLVPARQVLADALRG